MHLCRSCVFALLISFSPNSEQGKGSIHQLVFLTFGVRMNASAAAMKLAKKNSLYCKEKTTALHCSAPNICHLLHYCNNGRRRVSLRKAENENSLCKILLTSLKLCGIWLIVVRDERHSSKLFSFPTFDFWIVLKELDILHIKIE